MVKISVPRKTPEKDVERLAEKVWSDYGDEIIDIDSFNKYFNKYMGEMTDKQSTTLRKKVFTSVREEHKSVVEEVLKPKEGRPKKEADILKDKRMKSKFVHLRYSKNKIVYAREETITYLTKKEKEIEYTIRKRIVYRDRFGRFTSSKSLRERKGIKIHKVV